jgi:hypothetical protein
MDNKLMSILIDATASYLRTAHQGVDALKKLKAIMETTNNGELLGVGRELFNEHLEEIMEEINNLRHIEV